MRKTVLLVVDDDAASLGLVESELSRRYGDDYDVVSHASARSAVEDLHRLKDDGRSVAVLLADLWMPSMTGIDFLAAAHAVFPTAKRVLLIDWGDMSSRRRIVEASALGQMDCFMPKPIHSPDEAFHEVVSELLAEWTKAHGGGREGVRIIGEQWSPRCHEARDLLGRYGVPFGFYPSGTPQGAALLSSLGIESPPGPVFVLYDGRVLVDPSNAEVADALGGRADLSAGAFDVVVVGAGPAGLAAAVYASSEGLRTLVVEREAVGGQAGTTSRIRNYLGFPRGISGSDLAVRAFNQARHFGTEFHLLRESLELRPGFPHHVLTLSDGSEVRAGAVVVATGVTYRRLGVPSLDALVGRGVFYGPAVTEAAARVGQPVCVVGGGNSAGQAAVHLARYASRVTVLVRGDTLAASMSDYLVREISATPTIDVRYRTVVVDGSGDHHLERLVVGDVVTGLVDGMSAAGLFVLIGAEPHTGWLPPEVVRCARGYVVTGPDLLDESPGASGGQWPPLHLETSVPGLFAAGDVRHRSIKRVASAAGEGAMVIALIHDHLSRRSNQLAAVGSASPVRCGDPGGGDPHPRL